MVHNPKLTGERMNEVNEASPANKVSDGERVGMHSYEVKAITRKETEPFIIGIHYAKRWPSITWSFGLFDGGELVGVCTYGTPASATLKRGICGDELKDSVIELNRLCLRDNKKNEASFLVSSSLRLLPKVC